MKKIIKWIKEERDLLKNLEELDDKNLLKLREEYKIGLGVGSPPLNPDEKHLLAIALITDVSPQILVKSLKNLKFKKTR